MSLSFILRDDCTNCEVGCISSDSELQVWVHVSKDRCMGQAVLEFLKGLLTEGVPDVGNIEVRVGLLSQEVCERFC